jgi:hypothetical protein
MVRKRMGMQKIRDTTRLCLTTELSERQTGRALRVSRTVVASTKAQFATSGMDARRIAAMSDSAPEEALWCMDRLIDTPRYRDLEKRLPMMVLELKHKGMTLVWLWKQRKRSRKYTYAAAAPSGMIGVESRRK